MPQGHLQQQGCSERGVERTGRLKQKPPQAVLPGTGQLGEGFVRKWVQYWARASQGTEQGEQDWAGVAPLCPLCSLPACVIKYLPFDSYVNHIFNKTR